MVSVFDIPKNVFADGYADDPDNEGKVAIFDKENTKLIAEGDGDKDWVEIELLCEKMNEKDHRFYVMIVPKKSRSIKSYDWSTMKWEK